MPCDNSKLQNIFLLSLLQINTFQVSTLNLQRFQFQTLGYMDYPLLFPLVNIYHC